MAEWGVGALGASRGGLAAPRPAASPREVHLLQRKESGVGKGLGKTTGWVHRASLKARGVHLHTGVRYERIDDAGLHISSSENPSVTTVIPADTVVVCAGQESVNALAAELRERGARVHLVGGADIAVELDAKRAIRQATELAARI